MENISRFIETMLQNGSDGLLLIAGKQPVLRSAGKAHAFDASIITEAELTDFLTGPLDQPATITATETQVTLPFKKASAPVVVSVIRSKGTLALQVTPAPMPEAAPAAPEATAEQPTEVSVRTGGLVDYFNKMVAEGASDLHLSSGVTPFLRKDGAMVPLQEAPFTHDELHALLMEIIPERNRIEFENDFDTDFAYEIPGQARFRCNYFNDRNGCGAVFRQIPVEVLTAEQLGLPKELLRLCNLTKGLVLVTGPTGSGKSTTLAALIDHINKTRTDHIITIEDPIEFVHQNQKCLVNQREVNVHTKGFKPALRAALREDPDIVLVGELRDLETISIAIETAETGHLVFGTLHTTTAVSTIDRIIDQFPADRQGQIRVMLSESLRGVISQTLCKKKGGGRVAAQEILLYSRAIGNLIRESKTFQIPSAMQTGKKEGMIQLNDALLNLVDQDLITADEAFVRSVDKEGIQPLLAGKGLTLAD